MQSFFNNLFQAAEHYLDGTKLEFLDVEFLRFCCLECPAGSKFSALIIDLELQWVTIENYPAEVDTDEATINLPREEVVKMRLRGLTWN